jgi:rhodanese-related sulfurtransferase
MPIRQIDPQEAHRLMADGHIYLDVRSTSEFDRGHPDGAVNVPLLHAQPTGGMSPNGDFLRVCLANLPKDAKLVVGCAAGGRSQRACETLGANGYSTLANIQGGFSGARAPDGSVVAKGWADLGLPVSTEAGEGISYESLLKKTTT